MAANSGSIIIIHLNNITLIEDNNCQFILLAATFWQQLLQIFLLIWLEVFIHIGFGVCVFFLFFCLQDRYYEIKCSHLLSMYVKLVSAI